MRFWTKKKTPQPVRENWVWYRENPNEIAHMHLAGAPGKTHVIESIHAGYQVEYLVGLLTIQENMNVIFRQYVHNQRDIYGPFVIPTGSDARVTLHLTNKDVQCDVIPTLSVRGYTEFVPEAK